MLLLKFKDFKLDGHVFESVALFLPRQLHGCLNSYPAKHLFTYKLQHVSKNKLNTNLYAVILCLCTIKCYKIHSIIQCLIKHIKIIWGFTREGGASVSHVGH